MKQEWQTTGELLFGYPCLKHLNTGELCIFGKLGQIYKYNEWSGVCIIYKRNGSEEQQLFFVSELVEYIKKIKTKKSLAYQLGCIK